MFEVIACSVSLFSLSPRNCLVTAKQNHLLLDRFVNICSSIIIRHVNLYNIASVLVDASHYNATGLVKSLHKYMAQNLETLLEGHLLDELPVDINREFSRFVRDRQRDHHPHICSGGNLGKLEKKWSGWLSQQDIPAPIVPKSTYPSFRGPVSIYSVSFESKDQGKYGIKATPNRQTVERPISSATEEGIFQMDGEVSLSEASKVSSMPPSPAAAVAGTPPSPKARRVWKSQAVAEKASIRSIMDAEEQAATANRRTSVVTSTKAEGSTPTSTTTPITAKWTGWSSRPNQPPIPTISQPSFGSTDQPRLAPGKSGLGGRTESLQGSLPKQSGQGALAKPVSSPAKAVESRKPAVPGLGPLIVPTKSSSAPAQVPKRHKTRYTFHCSLSLCGF
jgi:hypothetical protein